MDSKTDNATIEAAFDNFTTQRKDIGILLINQHVSNAQLPYSRLFEPGCELEAEFTIQIAERIRHRVDLYTAAFPALLEIPSKDHPYDPEKDSVLRRVRRLFGE